MDSVSFDSAVHLQQYEISLQITFNYLPRLGIRSLGIRLLILAQSYQGTAAANMKLLY